MVSTNRTGFGDTAFSPFKKDTTAAEWDLWGTGYHAPFGDDIGYRNIEFVAGQAVTQTNAVAQPHGDHGSMSRKEAIVVPTAIAQAVAVFVKSQTGYDAQRVLKIHHFGTGNIRLG
jgi:hypothetical protein